MKARKAAGYGEIRHEMLKVLNHGVLWPIRVSQVDWFSGWYRKIGKLGDHPRTQRGRQ